LWAIQKVLAGEVLPNPWSPEAGGSSGSGGQVTSAAAFFQVLILR